MAPDNAALPRGMVDTASTLWSTLPHSLAAGRVQLKLLENAIFKAEQELEASWAKACFGQSPVPYVDEEWGSPWAALVAESTTKLCSFREARGKLLARMQELRLDDNKAASDSSENEPEEQQPEPTSPAENALGVMKDLLMQHLAEQAQLRSESHALVAQNAELRQKEAVWQERFQQQHNQLLHYEQLKVHMEQQLATIHAERSSCANELESLKLRNTELQKENATLKERCFQKEWCMKKVEEQTEKIRGDVLQSMGSLGVLADRCPDDVSILSDLSSWVCVSSSQPCVFLADATLKTPNGQDLQAMELCKGTELLAADGQSVIEVLDDPQEVLAPEVLELWAGNVILRVVPDHCLPVAESTKEARDLQSGDLVTVDGHQAALIQVESKKMSCPVSALQVTLSDGIPVAMVTRRLSDESPFAAAV
eukprot:symbB.v1.2.037075.t1/scaffold5377.1/size27851/2